MYRNVLLKKMFVTIIIMLLLCSCGENTANTSETSNLFQYALDMENEVFSPRKVEFFMNMEEVLQATGLKEYTVIEKDYEDLIRTSANIPGFPDDIMIDYIFSDNIGNRLTGVQYHLSIADKADAADVYSLLYEQAVATMPEASGNTIEGIKDGIDVSWEDKQWRKQSYCKLQLQVIFHLFQKN